MSEQTTPLISAKDARQEERARAVSAWTQVFERDRPEGHEVHVRVALASGTVYTGLLAHFSPDLEMANRELVLAPPMGARSGDSPLEPIPGEWERVILRGSDIERLGVQYRPIGRLDVAAPVRIDSGLYESVVSHPDWNDGKPVWLTRLDDDDVDGVPPGHMRVGWQADAPAPAEGVATVPADFMVTPYDEQTEADPVAPVRIDSLFGLIKQQDVSVIHPDWNDGKPVELTELQTGFGDLIDVTYGVPETHGYVYATVPADFLVTPTPLSGDLHA